MGAHFKLTKAHRIAIEDQVEQLIAFLDASDGDPDREPDDEDSDREAGNWVEDDETQRTLHVFDGDDREDDVPDMRHTHRDRIHRTRCDVVVHGASRPWAYREYLLRDPRAVSFGCAVELLS